MAFSVSTFLAGLGVPNISLEISLVIGAIVLLRFVWWLLNFVFARFLRPGRNLKSRVKADWALVTGASDGIGLAMATLLARRGFNVMIAARNATKLADAAEEIRSKAPKSEVDVIVADFNDDPAVYMEAVNAAVGDRAVGVLINNVGVSYPYARPFLEVPEELLGRLVNVNVVSMNHMCYRFLPEMVERRAGAIVNVGSGAGISPSAYLAAYAGTKAYVDSFSKALAIEYGPLGIDIQAHHPLLVCSKMSKIKRPSLTIPTPAGYAAAALNCVGYGPPSLLPFWAHELQHCVMSLWPLNGFAVNFVTNMHKSIYKRGKKKEERAKAE